MRENLDGPDEQSSGGSLMCRSKSTSKDVDKWGEGNEIVGPVQMTVHVKMTEIY